MHEWDPSDGDALYQSWGPEHDSPDRFDLGSLPRQPRSGRSSPGWPTGQPPSEQPAREPRPPTPRRSSSSPSFPPASQGGSQDGTARGGAAEQAGPQRLHRSLVRPYARTGGRVAPATDLQLESLVSAYDVAGAIASGAVASTMQRFICDLCAEEVKSIAEIAAYARLPLGVVKVIVSDLADAGAVSIQRPGMVTGDRSSQAFMERILEGLKSL
ncbi:DUF742 domain-containing protein [Prauserella halophila]|nr:DUF742 domain-containing protein [Prauserella halophila]MCP2235627.1 Protein of unknown function (DUF742) [Prauserella halophila]